MEYIPLKKADFMLFFETGDRLCYERKYFAGRKALTVLALRLLFGDREPATVEGLKNVIGQILSEPVWALPAHCGRDAWDTREYGIDLFAAETAGSLAQILWLTSKDGAFEGHRALVDAFFARFEKEILAKLEKEIFWWEEGDSNWTAVCAGNIETAAFCLLKMGLLSKALYVQLSKRLLKSFYTYLAGFGTDGCCREGISYYNYGMHYLLNVLELWESEGEHPDELAEIKSGLNKRYITRFLENTNLGGRSFVAFSDTTGHESVDAGIISYLSHIDPGLCLPSGFYEGEELCPADPSVFVILGGDECGRFSMALGEYNWVRDYGRDLKPGKTGGSALLKDAEWFVSRFEGGMAFAIKGGNNREPHNHNDVGSFTVAYKGIPVVAELGSGEYTAGYFGADRYKTLCTSSEGHNVPLCAGLQQKEDTEGGAFSFENGLFIKDLSPSYGLEAGTVQRRACCLPCGELLQPLESKRPSVRIEDHGVVLLVERLMFFSKPTIDGEKITVTVKQESGDSKTFIIKFENGEQPSLEELFYTDHNGLKTKVFRLSAKKQEGKEYIAIEITPA
ncbi:MAG: heparinase II/III family protein [Lachnospiraceae bacterium]|nr:heparinase II/III family protein [Lachnospiraceae bacterium]